MAQFTILTILKYILVIKAARSSMVEHEAYIFVAVGSNPTGPTDNIVIPAFNCEVITARRLAGGLKTGIQNNNPRA